MYGGGHAVVSNRSVFCAYWLTCVLCAHVIQLWIFLNMMECLLSVWYSLCNSTKLLTAESCMHFIFSGYAISSTVAFRVTLYCPSRQWPSRCWRAAGAWTTTHWPCGTSKACRCCRSQSCCTDCSALSQLHVKLVSKLLHRNTYIYVYFTHDSVLTFYNSQTLFDVLVLVCWDLNGVCRIFKTNLSSWFCISMALTARRKKY